MDCHVSDVDGEMISDNILWKQVFRMHIENKYFDPCLTPEVQAQRLNDLRCNARSAALEDLSTYCGKLQLQLQDVLNARSSMSMTSANGVSTCVVTEWLKSVPILFCYVMF